MMKANKAKLFDIPSQAVLRGIMTPRALSVYSLRGLLEHADEIGSPATISSLYSIRLGTRAL